MFFLHVAVVVVVVGAVAVAAVGRISMEKTMFSLKDVPADVHIGDPAVLMGTQGSESITAQDIAKSWGTIDYEVFTSVVPRQPRVYETL